MENENQLKSLMRDTHTHTQKKKTHTHQRCINVNPHILLTETTWAPSKLEENPGIFNAAFHCYLT